MGRFFYQDFQVLQQELRKDYSFTSSHRYSYPVAQKPGSSASPKVAFPASRSPPSHSTGDEQSHGEA